MKNQLLQILCHVAIIIIYSAKVQYFTVLNIPQMSLDCETRKVETMYLSGIRYITTQTILF